MKNISKLISLSISAFLFVFLSVTPAKAVNIQTGDNLTLPAGKIIDEAALVSGSTVTIDSDINGDLYCAGREVIINGDIKGDIACFAQTIKINGLVDGNIRVGAQTIEITGQVNRNLTVAAQTLTLAPKSNVKGDIFFGVQKVELGGLMGRDLAGAGETISITGSLLRNASVTGSTLSVIETGKIGGNLDYYMEKTATASIEKKNINGTVVRHDIETPQKPTREEVAKTTKNALVSKSIFGILSFSLIGFVLLYFDKKNTQKRLTAITQKPFATGLIGLAVLIVYPVFFVILMVTVIGIPLAFISLMVYLIALITASLYASMIYGQFLVERLYQKPDISPYWQMIIGVVLVGLLVNIPVVGWIISLISLCLGLGGYLLSFAPEKS